MSDVEDREFDELHSVKYPIGSRVEVIPLKSGQVLVIVKKRKAKYVALDKLPHVTQ